MYANDIRWWVLVPVSILIGLGQVFSEVSGLWFSFPSRPDWLWCLAFFAVLRSSPVSAIFAFGLCGFMRDVILGPKLGSACIAYLLIGWIALSWRILASDRGWFGAALLAGTTGFLVSVIRHSLDYGAMAYKLLDRVFFLSLGDAALTGLGFLPLALLLSLDSFRPWRERAGF